MSDRKPHFELQDGVGHYITEWYPPIPEWQATLIAAMPNANAMFTYKLLMDGGTMIFNVPPGNLMLEIHRVLFQQKLPV